jgi:hypothetical protein
MKDAASALFQTFIVDGIKAAQVQEDAINKLNSALAISGNYSKETSEDFQAFASALQQTTKFGDEATLSAAALIESLSNLSGEGLKKATASAADLSAALGIDLQSAAQLVGKAMTGEVSSLSRYGIQVQKGATAAESASNAMEALQKKFGGAAAAQVNTFSGAWTQLNNQFGDLQEMTGELITKNPVVIAMFKEFSEVMGGLSLSIGGNTDEMKRMVGEGIITVIDTLQGLITTFDYVWRTGSALWNGLKVSLYGFGAAASAVLEIFDISSKEVTDSFVKDFEDASEKVNTALFEQTGLVKINDTLDQVKESARTALESIGTASSETSNTIKNNQQAVVTAQEETDAKLLELRDAKKIADEEWRLAQDAAELQRRDARFAQLVTDLGLEQAIRRQAEINMTSDKVGQERLKLQTEVDANKKRLDDYKALQAAKKAENDKDLTNFASTTSSLGQIAALGGKKYFAITKALNLASAISSGIAAVSAAMAAPPGPPFNSGSVIATGVAAAANVARAASVQEPSFATGGIVPGSFFTGDNVKANLNSGEMVLTKNQQASLFNMANNKSSSPSSSSVEGLLVQLIDAVKSTGNQSISIDGREIINVVRDGLASGRSIA